MTPPNKHRSHHENVRETASMPRRDAAQRVMKSGFWKALAGIAIAATLRMLIEAQQGDPQERARQRKEREEAERSWSGEADGLYNMQDRLPNLG